MPLSANFMLNLYNDSDTAAAPKHTQANFIPCSLLNPQVAQVFGATPVSTAATNWLK
jgi:hypothetical protein